MRLYQQIDQQGESPRQQQFPVVQPRPSEWNIKIIISVLTVILFSLFLYVGLSIDKEISQADEVEIVQLPTQHQKDKTGGIHKILKYIPSKLKPQKQIQKQYFALRIKNYAWNETIAEAQVEENQLQYRLSEVHRELSFCLPIQLHNKNKKKIEKLVQSIRKQSYHSYKVYLYTMDDTKIPIQPSFSNHVQIINKQLNDMKECQDSDIVLRISQGELIGRLVFQRINNIYQNKQIQMTYSKVLGFCPHRKIPISQSIVLRSNNENFFIYSLFSQFLWSFRARHLPKILDSLKIVDKFCGKELISSEGVLALQNRKLSTYRIEEYDLFVEGEQKEQKTNCGEKILVKKFKLNKSNVETYIKETSQNPYPILTKGQLSSIVEQMQKVPKIEKYQRYINSDAYFAYRVSLQEEVIEYRVSEYHYYQNKYQIDSFKEEIPFCVVIQGINVQEKQKIKNFIHSLRAQNYTNYHVLYLSDGNFERQIEDLIFYEFPQMGKKIQLVNWQNNLQEKRKILLQHCSQDEYVIEVDVSDRFIGEQVFKLFNALYSQNDSWLIHSKSIKIYENDENQMKIQTIKLQPFALSQLKSYRLSLFVKIDEIEFEDKNDTLYQEIHSFFIYNSLAQLAGKDRVLYLEEYCLKSAKNNINEDLRSRLNYYVQIRYPYSVLKLLENQTTRTYPKIFNEPVYYGQRIKRKQQIYKPLEKKQENQDFLLKIIQKKNKIYVGSDENVIKKGIISEFFRVNTTFQSYKLEQYYFDTRNQSLFYKHKQLPFLIVVDAQNPQKNFRQFYRSLIRQDYLNISLLLTYTHEHDRQFMKEVMIKEYPILLESTSFLLNSVYPSLHSVLSDFCREDSLVMQLSMESELVGTQSLMFINSVLRSSKTNTEGVVAYSMMQINDKKVEIQEVGKDSFESQKQYLNYHNTHKGIFAFRVDEKSLNRAMVERKIEILPNVLTSHVYNLSKKLNPQKVMLMQSQVMLLKTQFKSKQIKKSPLFKLKPFVHSYISSRWWKEPQEPKYIKMEEYLYHNHYGFGQYTYQQPLCIIATGRSPELLETYQHFLSSLLRQNYTNYAVVLGHLNFDKEVDAKIKKFIEEKGEDFQNKIRKIKGYTSEVNEGFFKIKANLIEKYCQDGELIVDVDAGDQLIGKNVLGLINTVFQANPQIWFSIANSLYEDPEEDEKNRILPATAKQYKFFWELFHYDKVKIIRKQFFRNVASELPPQILENEAYLRIFQLSGPRFYYLSEFLSFDYRTQLYSPLTTQQKYDLFQILSLPYYPIRYNSDKERKRHEPSFSGGLSFQSINSLFFFNRLLDRESIEKRRNELEEEKLNFFLDSVMQPIENKKNSRKDSMYLFYRLKEEPNNENYLKAEYIYTNQKYKIEKYPEELPICVISAGRNLKEKDQSYKLYIDSMARINYTNFRLIYTDDMSDDGTAEAMRKYTDENYPLLSKKLKIVENEERVYSLANKNSMIRYHCNNENDIIYDIDADDYLLGRQFFKVLNTIYQKGDYWLVYANYCMIQSGKLMKGYSKSLPQNLMADYSYRRRAFVTIGPRSFLRKLYIKIDEKQFQNQAGQYYIEISDGFIYVALAELAGIDHSYFVPETPYFYDTYNNLGNLEVKRQNAYIMKRKTPFENLQNLQVPVKKIENYELNELYEGQIKETLRWYETLIKKRDEQLKQRLGSTQSS